MCTQVHTKFLLYLGNHHHTTTVLWPSFRDHPGEPVPEENFWTLWCKGRLKEADTLTIRLGATPSGLTSGHLHHPPIFFCRPDALPVAQPTASSTEGNQWEWKIHKCVQIVPHLREIVSCCHRIVISHRLCSLVFVFSCSFPYFPVYGSVR